MNNLCRASANGTKLILLSGAVNAFVHAQLRCLAYPHHIRFYFVRFLCDWLRARLLTMRKQWLKQTKIESIWSVRNSQPKLNEMCMQNGWWCFVYTYRVADVSGIDCIETLNAKYFYDYYILNYCSAQCNWRARALAEHEQVWVCAQSPRQYSIRIPFESCLSRFHRSGDIMFLASLEFD